MAPWSSSSPSTADQEQPAARFRRFADEQITALLNGVSTLPGMHSAADNAKARTALQDWEKGTRSATEKMDSQFPSQWAQLLESPLRKPGQGADAVTEDTRQAARALLLQARNANMGANPDKILALYQDHGDSMLPVVGPVPIRASGTAGWLGIDWFRKNAYSPIQLEQHEHTHQHGSMWRAAFEDLLATALDKEPSSREVWEGSVDDEGQFKAWGAPGMDWMLGLQCRGLLPPQLPSLYNITPAEKKKLDRVFGKIIAGTNLWTPYGKVVKRDFEQLARVIASPEMDDIAVKAVVQPENELNLYEKFGDEEKNEKSEPKVSRKQGGDRNDMEKSKFVENKNSVVATLTTTKTTVLPDGTTTTRRVLKKRFADGREETNEEVSSGQDGSQSGAGEKNDKGGWFWS